MGRRGTTTFANRTGPTTHYNSGALVLSTDPEFAGHVSGKLDEGLAKAGVVSAERHLFLCLGPDCCRTREGEETWDYIKRRVKETRLKVMRTKAACFRICTEGPWLVVYPDGVWYSRVTPERFERILHDHLLGGQPVSEWVVARNDLQQKPET